MESMKNYDGALVEYKKAVEMAPQQPGTHLHLGNAYFALAMWDPAGEQFNAELQNDPQNCEALWKLGNIQLEQHSASEESLTYTDKAIALCPNLREAHVDRGRALLKLGRAEEASKDLKVAVEADPSVSSTHFLLAQAYRAEGKTKEAQEEMRVFSKLEESAREASAERLRNVEQSKEKPN
jgi:tetratricopeptide (TPR) repeat protein